MLKKWWFWVLVFIVIIAVASAGSKSPIDNPVVNTIGGSNPELITLSEFNQIENGMTYEQVKEIVGSEGTLIAESGTGDVKVTMYQWYGNTMTGANANFSFTNNQLTTKAQFGLTD